MRNVIEYGLLFVALVLLQVFLFDNLNFSIYLYPLIYVGFILLLPMNINSTVLLLLSFLIGVTVDFLSGMNGLHTIASLATGFVRPIVLNLTIGKDASREGGMPLPLTIGRGKWLRYAVVLVSIHCLLFFFFEIISFRYFWFTLLRTFGSILTTTLLLWFLASLFPARQQHRNSML